MHSRALPAALASEAAGKQGKFWEMHDLLFQDTKALTDENFDKWAKELGLDVAKFHKDMKDPELTKKIKADQRHGSVVGARGTPAFFVNGRFLSGAQPVDRFVAIIDEEVKKADKMVSGGVKREAIYDEVMKKAKPKL
jgi:protein-disulfide isomerase